MGLLLDIPLRLDPLDIVLVSGPLAVLLLLAAIVTQWWRPGRPIRNMLINSAATAALLAPAAVAAIIWWHPAALLIIGAVLLFWVVRSYRRTTSPIGLPTRLLCVSIRGVTIVLVLLLLLRPTYTKVRVIYEKATLFLLFDGSRSMTIDDAPGKATRAAAVRDAVAANGDRINALSEAFDVEQYVFDDGLREELSSLDELALTPSGESTSLGRALQQAHDKTPGRPIAGVILITDGADNTDAPGAEPQKASKVLADAGAPIWPVAVGRPTPDTDKPIVIAKEIALPSRRVPAFNVLPVRASYELLNLPDRPVKLELVFGQGRDARVADAKVVRPAADKKIERVTFTMNVTPTTTGFHAVTVRVAEGQKDASGQPLDTPISRVTDYVQVVDDVLQVLYVEGKFRLEARYLIDALAGSDLMRLNRQFVLTQAALDGGSKQLPQSADEWRRYHVVILGDVKANAFTADQLRTIRDMVRDLGKGLLLLGGPDSFGQGGWPESPLAEVAPLDLAKARGQITEPFQLIATPQGLTHQLMKLTDDASLNARLWGLIPTIQGANRFPTLAEIQADRPAAIVLATTPRGQPVMVAQQAGQGRVLATGIDTTWRWRFHLGQLPGGDTGQTLHNRFWRQVVQWLAHRQGNVWITTDQPRYRLSQVRAGSASNVKIQVKAGIEDQTGKPIRDAGATIELIPPPGVGRSVKYTNLNYSGDHYELAELPAPTADGNYKLVFSATLDGKPATAETSFLVESTDVELSRPLANYDLLKQLAAVGEDIGGKFYTLDQLDKLLDRFKSSNYLIRREEPQVTNLADRFRWPVLVIIVVGLMAEWVVRKWRGLV